MAVQPKALASDIFQRLYDCSADPSSVNEFTIRRLQNDADKLINFNPVAGYTALGCISYLKHDTEAMLENHLKALRISPNDFHSNINFSVSLSNSGRYKESSNYTLKALSLTSELDINVLRQTCIHLASAGLFLQSAHYVEKLLDMKFELQYKDPIVSAAKLINEMNLDENIISDYFCCVTEIMTDNDVYPCGESLWDAEDDFYYVVREVLVDVEPLKAAKMNRDLSKLVATKSFPELTLKHFSSSFTAGRIPPNAKVSNGYTA